MRILETYNFENQTTYGINGPIKTATLIGPNKLAIANDIYIKIYCIEERNNDNKQSSESSINDDLINSGTLNPNINTEQKTKEIFYFTTFGDIHELKFCKIGNYLLSLENFASFDEKIINKDELNNKQQHNKNKELKVRVYTNLLQVYDNYKNNCNNINIDYEIPLIVPRIAAKVTPTVRCNGIEMIELDITEPPDMITCCEETGNILVKSKIRLYLYEYRECYNETQRFNYIDFFEFPFYVELNFIPIQIKLVENVCAAVSKKNCTVFKIINIKLNDINNSNLQIDDSGGISLTTSATTTTADSSISEITGSGIAGYSKNYNNHEDDEKYLNSNEDFNSSDNKIKYNNNKSTLPPHMTTCIDFKKALELNIGYNNETLICEIESSLSNNLKDLTKKETTNATTTKFQTIEDYPTQSNDIKVKLIENNSLNNEWNSELGIRTAPQPSALLLLSSESASSSSSSPSVPVNQLYKYDIKKLLQIQMASVKQKKISIGEKFTCLDLKAIYIKEHNNNKTNKKPMNPKTQLKKNHFSMKSKLYNNCIGFSFIITTTASDGYLYQFSNNYKWHTDNEKPLTKYQFTAPVLDVIINDFVLHAITRDTIETVTSRIGHKLFTNYYEYPMLSLPYPYQTSPTPDMQIFCMKLHTFINTYYSLTTLNNIILISSTLPVNNQEHHQQYNNDDHDIKSDNNKLSWTVYNLKMPDPIRLANDLDECAKETLNGNINIKKHNILYNDNSSIIDLVYELLTESNIILRLAKYLNINYTDIYRQNIDEIYYLNCKKLADLVIRSDNEEKYSDAIGYYRICKTLPYDIYKTYFDNLINENKIEKNNIFIGLLHTMKIYIINFIKKRSDSNCLYEQHNIIYKNDNLLKFLEMNNNKLNRNYEILLFGHELFNFFYINNTNTLSIIGLKSIPFLDCNINNYILYFDIKKKLTNYDLLLNSLVLCRNKNYNLALNKFEKISRIELYFALKFAFHIIFDEYNLNDNNIIDNDDNINNDYNNDLININLQTFSEFTETILFHTKNLQLIEAISDVFIYYLCITNKININCIFDLFVNYFSLHVEYINDIDNNNNDIPRKICEIILGVYFYEYFSTIDINSSNNDQIKLTTTMTTSSSATSINISAEHLTNDDDDVYDNNDNGKILTDIIENNENPSKDTNFGGDCNNIDLNTLSNLSLLTNDEKLNFGLASTVQSNLYNNDVKKHKLNINDNVDENIQRNGSIIKDNSESKALILLLRLYLGNLLIATRKQQPNTKDNKLNIDDKKLYILKIREEYVNDLIKQKIKLNNNKNNVYHKFNEISPKILPNYENFELEQSHKFDHDKNFDIDNSVNIDDDNSDNPEDDIQSYIRPIACLDERPVYLNRMKPFKSKHFLSRKFIGYNDDIIVWVLKIQCLLSSQKTDYIIPDFLSFIQKNLDLIGIDSFITILLPNDYGIKYLMQCSPDALYDYGKYYQVNDNIYCSILRQLISNVRNADVNSMCTNEEYKKALDYTLDHLFNDRTFESFLNCLPPEEIQLAGKDIYRQRNPADYENIIGFNKNDIENLVNDKESNIVMDNVDETNIFQLMLRKGVARQRCEALNAMIESTGKQLFEASKNQ